MCVATTLVHKGLSYSRTTWIALPPCAYVPSVFSYPPRPPLLFVCQRLTFLDYRGLSFLSPTSFSLAHGPTSTATVRMNGSGTNQPLQMGKASSAAFSPRVRHLPISHDAHTVTHGLRAHVNRSIACLPCV